MADVADTHLEDAQDLATTKPRIAAREVKHLGGVGINSQYGVFDDGRRIGWIGRDRYQGFLIKGLYDRNIGRRKTLKEAREFAMTTEFPSEDQAWRDHFDETRGKRQRVMERTNGSQIASLARKVLEGGNEARSDLIDLLAEIERNAADADYTVGQSGGYLARYRKRATSDQRETPQP